MPPLNRTWAVISSFRIRVTSSSRSRTSRFRSREIGYQAVGGIDVKVTSLSEIGLISRTLNLPFAQLVHVVQSGLNLLLDF
jgi:hypothetical protein